MILMVKTERMEIVCIHIGVAVFRSLSFDFYSSISSSVWDQWKPAYFLFAVCKIKLVNGIG